MSHNGNRAAQHEIHCGLACVCVTKGHQAHHMFTAGVERGSCELCRDRKGEGPIIRLCRAEIRLIRAQSLQVLLQQDGGRGVGWGRCLQHRRARQTFRPAVQSAPAVKASTQRQSHKVCAAHARG
jgi:hypothetical protein